MNATRPLHKTLRRLALTLPALALLPFTACAVFSHRYHTWNRQVSRTEDGVLTFAQAQTYGSGRNALLLVHGFGDGPHVWQNLAPLLAAEGYTVRAMRLPGWGEPIDAKRSITADHWLNAIRHELDTLLSTHDHVAVLAHSLGGCLTTVLAQDQNLPADALVLYAPMFEVSSARSPLLKTGTWFHIGDTLLPESMIIESIFGDHARVQSPRPPTQRDPFNPKNIFRILYAEMDHFNRQPPAVTLPVRLVLPGEDRVVRSERSLQWFEDLKAPSKTLHTEPPAGHVLPLDIDSLAETDRLVLWFTQQGITP